MRSPFKPRSVVRTATLLYVGPFIAVAVLALVAFGFAALGVGVQLLATLVKHAGL